MIKSMTGFGKGQAKFQKGKIVAEIKTVNHKFLDLSLKLPESMISFEDRIKEMIQKRIQRGKANLNLSYDGVVVKGEKVSLNKELAKGYYREMLGLKKRLGIEDEIGIKDIVALPGVINYSVKDSAASKAWPKAKAAIEEAIGRLVADREKEGRAICHDLAGRAAKIEKMLAIIKSRSHINIEEYRNAFADKIKDLTNGREIDMGRLEMEVAIYAKNSDISEEITRLKSHLANFKNTIISGGELGKKLDFIAQELHREINTVGSKVSDFGISKNAIDIKSEVEKIREQVKNLE